MTLEDFIQHPITATAHQNWQVGYIASESILKLRQVRPFYGTLAEQLAAPIQPAYPSLGLQLAQERLASFAMFGLCERFQEARFLLDYTFGWKPTPHYQSYNVATHRLRRDDLNPALVDGILALNTEDTALYDYGVTLFEERFTQMCQDLLENYGTAQHAHLKLPLAPAFIIELLEKHYQRGYQMSHPEPQPTFFWDMVAAIAGSSWHPTEPLADGHPVRWTGPATTTTLDLTLAADTDYTVEFMVRHVLSIAILDSITMRINDEIIELERAYEDGAGFHFTGTIPQAIVEKSAGLVALAWTISHTMQAREADPANEDPRELGLMITGVKVMPAESL